MNCKLLDFDSADWKLLDAFPDRTVFQTKEWIQFIGETQAGTPVLVELRQGRELAGYFTGVSFSRLGIKVLGSSFPGWTTPYMGFNMLPGCSRSEALAAVEEFAWNTLKCSHIEVSDPNFTQNDGQALGFDCDFYSSYRTDLRKPEDTLFGEMDSVCRRCIRKAEKVGVTVEPAHDIGFADEYYEQLKDVFAKQGLVPTYSVERVRALIKYLEPTGRLLLLRARDPQGKCIATGIMPGLNKVAEFWGNASFRSSQALRPNEAIHWYAMRYWKSRGIEVYDWGGEGHYKEKYGCTPHLVPWFTKSRNKFVSTLRHEAKKMFGRKQRLRGWWQSKKTPQTANGPSAEPPSA